MAPAKKTGLGKEKVVRKRHDNATVTKAIDAIKGGLSFRKASAIFGIPLGTLVDKVKGRRPLYTEKNTSSLLTLGEEQKLVEWLTALTRSGFGHTVDDLRMTAKRLIDLRREKEGSSSSATSEDTMPSRAWAYHFVKRRPQLTKRNPVSLCKERAVICSDAVRGWFEELRSCCNTIDPELLKSPQRLFNADEMGFSFDPKSRKVIAEKGTKHVYKVTTDTKKQVTVLACTSAAGQYLPPTLIYPYKRIPTKNLLADFPGALIQASDNGWITAPIFFKWLEECFIPAVKPLPKPVLLLVDGHPSHMSMVEITEICLENQVMLFCLLPHASHLIQPLDQALFGSLKPEWGEASREHIFHTGEGVGLDSFAGVFRRAWEKSATKAKAEKSFKAAGIYPFNPDTVLLAGNLGLGAVFQKQALSNASGDTPHVDDYTSTTTSPIPSDNPVLPNPSNIIPISLSPIPSDNLTPPSASIPTALPPIPSDNLIPPSPLNITPTFFPSIPSNDPDPASPSNLVPTSFPPTPSNNASFPNALQEHTRLPSSPAPPSFILSDTVKAMTVEQLSALRAYTVFIQEEIGSRKSKDFLDRLSTTQPQPAGDHDFQSFHYHVQKLTEAFARKTPEKVSLTQEDILKLPKFKSSKGCGKRKMTPTIPHQLSSEEQRSLQKKKNLDKEEAKRKKNEKKEGAARRKGGTEKKKRGGIGGEEEEEERQSERKERGCKEKERRGEEDEVGVFENNEKSAVCETVKEPSILWIQY